MNGQRVVPLMARNWTAGEWEDAEALVFEKRLSYPVDSLAAIYRDISINLQAELTRIKKEAK